MDDLVINSSISMLSKKCKPLCFLSWNNPLHEVHVPTVVSRVCKVCLFYRLWLPDDYHNSIFCQAIFLLVITK